jgi:hypothetical protein
VAAWVTQFFLSSCERYVITGHFFKIYFLKGSFTPPVEKKGKNNGQDDGTEEEEEGLKKCWKRRWEI